MPKKNPIIDVIIPVYAGFAETVACIESVFKHPQQQTICNLIIINDCGPDPAIDEYLANLSPRPYLNILHNEVNLGFVGTVNRGMSINPNRDVLLLNSDTEVNGNWLDRIYAHYVNDPTIATITPFSNNATICSFPNTCEDNVLPFDVSIAQVDAAFSSCGKDQLFDVPTGVGFCMFISRVSINAVGLFDVEAFGKGYGEENDFCLRVSKAGYRNVLCGDTYVFHAGSVSFAEGRHEKIDHAMKVISARYPDYPRLVQEHIALNPAKKLRTEVIIMLIKQDKRPKVVTIGHGIGGGVQYHMNSLRTFLADKIIQLEIAPIPQGDSVCFDFGSNQHVDKLQFRLADQYTNLVRLLNHLEVSRVHYHHFMNVSPQLRQLYADLNAQFYFTIHDYYCLNGNPSLTDTQGNYCGDDSLQKRDVLSLKSRPLPDGITAEQWRADFSLLLKKADCIIAPSVDCQQRFKQDFPELTVIATPHEDFYRKSNTYESSNSKLEPLKVLTLGAISPEKGADIIEACANYLVTNKANITIELLGYAYRQLDASVKTHGHYDSLQLQVILHEIKPDIIWLPARWPETYSYTLSAALEYGCPVAVSDLGAPAERIRQRDNSWALPWQSSAQQWAEFFIEFQQGSTLAHYQKTLPNAEYEQDFYLQSYLKIPIQKTNNSSPLNIEELLQLSMSAPSHTSNKERVLLFLYRLYTHRYLRHIAKLVPVHLLRRIKRALSNQPIDKLLP
jgi:GT2 family glycosyltransferase/glycosyltransferase involved in cell wall biosynthesis